MFHKLVTLSPDGIPDIEQHLHLGKHLKDLLVEVRHRVVHTGHVVTQDAPPSFS